MREKEKTILKALVNDSRGLLSPAEFINGVAERDRRSIENLIAEGYVEEVPQQKTNILGDKVITHTYDFYRATKKGRDCFAPFYKKMWFGFTQNTALYVGISAIILGIVTNFFSYQALHLSQEGNDRASLEFQSRTRPYVTVDSIDSKIVNASNQSTQYTFHLKNTGLLPAKVTNVLASCIYENKELDRGEAPGKNKIIGNDQTILDFWTLTAASAECEYIVQYQVALDSFSKLDYETAYTILHRFGQALKMQDSKLK